MFNSNIYIYYYYILRIKSHMRRNKRSKYVGVGITIRGVTVSTDVRWLSEEGPRDKSRRRVVGRGWGWYAI